jgi:hypothetical protein
MVGSRRPLWERRRPRTDGVGGLRLGDGRHKTIAPPVHGGNEPRRLCGVAQGPAELADGDAHHRITDGRFRPDGVQQGVFGDQTVGMPYQIVQHVEGFGRQRNGLRTAPEAGIVRVQPEAAKVPLGGGHPLPPLLPRGIGHAMGCTRGCEHGVLFGAVLQHL